MFALNHARAAGEMVRVCRPKGRIGLANWTPRGFIGQLLSLIGRYAPPPAGLQSPSRWGTDDHLEELFRASASDIHTTLRDFVFRYRSPQHWIDVFRTWYGPVHKAFAGLSEEAQRSLERDLIALVDRFNVSGDATMVVPAEYAETVIVKE
jgi:hypothetical protein